MNKNSVLQSSVFLFFLQHFITIHYFVNTITIICVCILIVAISWHHWIPRLSAFALKMLNWKYYVIELYSSEMNAGGLPFFFRMSSRCTLWTFSLCRFKLCFVEYFIEHIVHWNGFSPVWVRKCRLRSFIEMHGFRQISHSNFHFEWASMWVDNSECLRVRLQRVHWKFPFLDLLKCCVVFMFITGTFCKKCFKIGDHTHFS